MAKMKSEEELAELEKLSAAFVPEQKGDLVGPLVSSQQLAEEYAKADPVYASKTQSLPSTYPHYRPIKGDGNCGFRALAFGYFEALARWDSGDKFRQEAVRLKSLNSLLDATGQEALMYDDWVEETLDLLEKAGSISSEHVANLFMDTFNDSQKANAITQHFRMLTSAQIKLNADEYAPFVPDLDVEAYCKNHVDPFYEEIEHVGVKALVDTVINKAGIAVNYLYLDRSEGTEATPYSFPIRNEQGEDVEDAPTVRLLYRPGHYDLLYTKDDLDKPPATKLEATTEAVTEVRVLHTLPQPRFPEHVSFNGLPGLDPLAQFHFADVEALYGSGDELARADYQPDVDGYDRAMDGSNPISPPIPYTGLEGSLEQGMIDEQGSSGEQTSQGDIKIQSPNAALLTSVPPLDPGQIAQEQETLQEGPISRSGRGATVPSQPKGQEESHQIIWSPRTFHQMDYDNSITANSSLQLPLPAILNKHSPVTREPHFMLAKDGVFNPKQYDGATGQLFHASNPLPQYCGAHEIKEDRDDDDKKSLRILPSKANSVERSVPKS